MRPLACSVVRQATVAEKGETEATSTDQIENPAGGPPEGGGAVVAGGEGAGGGGGGAAVMAGGGGRRGAAGGAPAGVWGDRGDARRQSREEGPARGRGAGAAGRSARDPRAGDRGDDP